MKSEDVICKCGICGIEFEIWEDADSTEMTHTCQDCACGKAEGLFIRTLGGLEDGNNE